MIRFLNLKNQICEGEPSFAYYNTVPDVIISFYGEQVFYSLKSFEYHWENDGMSKSEHFRLERFTRLIPEDFFEQKTDSEK